MCCLKYFTYNNGIIIGHETYHESASEQINNYDYRMAGNFGGKIFWRIAENMSFDGIYFGG